MLEPPLGSGSPSLEQPDLWTLSRAVCPIHGLNHAQLSLLRKELQFDLPLLPPAREQVLPTSLLRLLPPQVLLSHSPAPVVYLEESGISRDASWVSQQSQRHPDCPTLLGSPRSSSSFLGPHKEPTPLTDPSAPPLPWCPWSI